MTIRQSQSSPPSLPVPRLGLAASLLVLSGMLLFIRELAMSFPGGPIGPATRLALSVIFAWGLLRRHTWAWWASVLVGTVWILMGFMTAGTMFALSGSLEPLYRWPEFPITGAFIAQAVAMALLLRQRTRLPSAVTLSVILVGLVVVVLGFWMTVSRSGEFPTQNNLGGSIYSTVTERVRTPAVKVSIGIVNGAEGVSVVIADSTLVHADSTTQAVPSREIATLVRSLLPAGSDLEFIAIGWSLDTGPGVIPSKMHRYLVDDLPQGTPDAPR